MAHAGAFLPLEEALGLSGADDLSPGWSATRRAQALESDLIALGLALPALATSPRFTNEAELLGGLYVLEGSRLGGAVLIRSVPPGLPTAFLTPGNPTAWRTLTALLDERLRLQTAMEDAVNSALRVFETFEQSARNLRGAVGRDG